MATGNPQNVGCVRALVVDDDDSVLLIAARWLLEAGYMVTTAGSFEEGLKAVQQPHCPEVLVVDVRLKDFNGLQLAILARQQRPDTRIIVTSGWDDPVLRADAEQCGAAYLCKPFSCAQLLAAA